MVGFQNPTEYWNSRKVTGNWSPNVLLTELHLNNNNIVLIQMEGPNILKISLPDHYSSHNLKSVPYSNHLNTQIVWYSNGRFVSDCQKVRYSNGGLKTELKKVCLWSSMSGIQMVRQVM